MDKVTEHQQEKVRQNNKLTFFKGFLQYPEQVGSIIPSSKYLERSLVDVASISNARSVVELGPGTGGTTQAILDALPDDAKFLAIELNFEFVKLLETNPDPRLIVHYGTAEETKEILTYYNIEQPDAVISGIPFSTMPYLIAQRILKNIWDSLKPGGHFVAYQFRDRVAELGKEIFGKPETKIEFLNVPPVRVYSWKKPEIDV